MKKFIVLGMALLLADYTLTPALICLVKPFGKEREVSA